jgi:hypothetical protein
MRVVLCSWKQKRIISRGANPQTPKTQETQVIHASFQITLQQILHRPLLVDERALSRRIYSRRSLPPTDFFHLSQNSFVEVFPSVKVEMVPSSTDDDDLG